MKNYKEMADSVFQRSDEIIAENKRKRNGKSIDNRMRRGGVGRNSQVLPK